MDFKPSKISIIIGWILVCVTLTNASEGHHQSGISGQIVGVPTFVTASTITITSSDGGKYFANVATDNNLHFEVSLKPGTYTLVIHPISPVANLFLLPGTPQVVQLDKQEVKELTFTYSSQPQ